MESGSKGNTQCSGRSISLREKEGMVLPLLINVATVADADYITSTSRRCA